MTSPDATPKASLSDYLAAERTLLAWIRTGLALMGFGFVVARFGLFLRQIELVNHEAQAQNFGFSLWFGTALIAVGVFVNILAGYRHVQLVRRLERGDQTRAHHATPAVIIAFFLAVVGLAMTVYLVTIRG
jgi:putative membrane protein